VASGGRSGPLGKAGGRLLVAPFVLRARPAASALVGRLRERAFTSAFCHRWSTCWSHPQAVAGEGCLEDITGYAQHRLLADLHYRLRQTQCRSTSASSIVRSSSSLTAFLASTMQSSPLTILLYSAGQSGIFISVTTLTGIPPSVIGLSLRNVAFFLLTQETVHYRERSGLDATRAPAGNWSSPLTRLPAHFDAPT